MPITYIAIIVQTDGVEKKKGFETLVPGLTTNVIHSLRSWGHLFITGNFACVSSAFNDTCTIINSEWFFTGFWGRPQLIKEAFATSALCEKNTIREWYVSQRMI